MSWTQGALVALERAHAVTAWGATLALFAAPLVRGPRRALAAGATFTLLVATSALGVLLDQPYRQRIRQHLFITSPSLGWAFERKEHAAFAALLLAGSGLAALILARRRVGAALAASMGASARLAWATSALLALAASLASAVVARRAPF